MATRTPWLQRWREDRSLAHIAPLVVFQVLQLPQMIATNNPASPWYLRAPEQWVYPLQTVVCGTLLWWWWPRYEFTRPSAAAMVWAVVAGLLGIALWILPCELYHRGGFSADTVGWLAALGVQAREHGFDPRDAPWPAFAVGMRLLRMVVVVACLEEVFWRGFLMRWLVDPERPVWSQPFGRHHWRALVGSVIGVVLVHQSADYAAALCWGLLLYFVAVHTRSLAACVLAHATANFVLGLYVLYSGHYGFW